MTTDTLPKEIRGIGGELYYNSDAELFASMEERIELGRTDEAFIINFYHDSLTITSKTRKLVGRFV